MQVTAARSAFAPDLPPLDWSRIAADLDARGYAETGPLLTPGGCQILRSLYDQPNRFRSRVVMGRHGFGQGEYQYFSNPLPEPLPALRQDLYAGLAPSPTPGARGWGARHPSPTSSTVSPRCAAPPVRPAPPR